MTRQELIAEATRYNELRNLDMTNIHRMPTARLQGIVDNNRLTDHIEANREAIQARRAADAQEAFRRQNSIQTPQIPTLRQIAQASNGRILIGTIPTSRSTS